MNEHRITLDPYMALDLAVIDVRCSCGATLAYEWALLDLDSLIEMARQHIPPPPWGSVVVAPCAAAPEAPERASRPAGTGDGVSGDPERPAAAGKGIVA